MQYLHYYFFSDINYICFLTLTYEHNIVVNKYEKNIKCIPF